MMDVYLDKTYFKHSARHQAIEMYALAGLGFLIPFAIGHPQLLVGAAVNALIIRASLSLPLSRALPVLVMPSVGALARGLVFGPYTVYLLYMIPFIWIGNAILFTAFKAKAGFKLKYRWKLLAGCLAKAGFLYGSAYVLYSAGIVPALFLTAFGILQLVTALMGGAIAYPPVFLEKRVTRSL
ncbi:MAG: hypothetical protein ABH834_06030 [Candidatus Altiarchaeota archaeon]